MVAENDGSGRRLQEGPILGAEKVAAKKKDATVRCLADRAAGGPNHLFDG
jgi:hypothetical protein